MIKGPAHNDFRDLRARFGSRKNVIGECDELTFALISSLRFPIDSRRILHPGEFSFSIRNVLESAGSDLVAVLLEAEGNSNETTTRIAPRQSRKSLVSFRFSLLFIESREGYKKVRFVCAFCLASCFYNLVDSLLFIE